MSPNSFLSLKKGLIAIVGLVAYFGSLVQAQTVVNPTPLSIDWTSVKTTPSISNLEQDLSTCLCDLTLNACDPNCCCDPDCSSTEKTAFFKGGCSLEFLGNVSAIPFCSKDLVLVNHIDETPVLLTRNSNNALCVVSANSPIKGTFFSNPGTFTSESVFLEQFGLSPFPLKSSTYSEENALIKSAKPYQFGDSIKINYATSGLDGALQLPRATESNVCNSASPMKFGLEETSSCSRVITASAASCAAGTVFDANYYTKGFEIYTNPPATTRIAVTVRNTYCFNSVTGVLTTCTFALPALAGVLCNNALMKLDYIITYDINSSGAVVLSSTVVDLTLTNGVPMNPGSTVEQTFTTTFISAQHPNPLDVSGNPGYVLGSPVLAGTLTTSNGKSAITRYTDPLFQLSVLQDFLPLGGSQIGCPTATDKLNRLPVKFGENLVSYCTLYYTLAQLQQNNCGAIRQQVYGIQTLTAAGLNRVGKFGNASILAEADWISIINEVPSAVTGSKTITETSTGTCSSLLTEFGIEFLVANFGSVDNPQRGIVGVRYNYVSGSFAYRCTDPSYCADPSLIVTGSPSSSGTAAQPFRLKSTVSWVDVEVDRKSFVPPPPRLIPPLPNDIFYPFQL